MKLLEKYIKLRSIVKKLGLNKKYSCWRSKFEMSGKVSPEFQWTDNDIQLLMEVTESLKVKKGYKGLNWELTLCFNSGNMLVTLHTKCNIPCNTKLWHSEVFFSIPQKSCFHSWNHSIILNYDVVLPRNDVASTCFLSSHFAFRSQSS